MSTYTKRINVMRGIDGKQADDDIGINHMLEPKDRISKDIVNPWKVKSLWWWNDSSHPQFKYEQNEKYVDQIKKLTVDDHPLSSKVEPPQFTKTGFKKIKLPDELYDEL